MAEALLAERRMRWGQAFEPLIAMSYGPIRFLGQALSAMVGGTEEIANPV